MLRNRVPADEGCDHYNRAKQKIHVRHSRWDGGARKTPLPDFPGMSGHCGPSQGWPVVLFQCGRAWCWVAGFSDVTSSSSSPAFGSHQAALARVCYRGTMILLVPFLRGAGPPTAFRLRNTVGVCQRGREKRRKFGNKGASSTSALQSLTNVSVGIAIALYVCNYRFAIGTIPWLPTPRRRHSCLWVLGVEDSFSCGRRVIVDGVAHPRGRGHPPSMPNRLGDDEYAESLHWLLRCRSRCSLVWYLTRLPPSCVSSLLPTRAWVGRRPNHGGSAKSRTVNVRGFRTGARDRGGGVGVGLLGSRWELQHLARRLPIRAPAALLPVLGTAHG